MSKDELHQVAQSDTPQAVEVPKTWQGLIVWAVGRFGAGIVMAGAFAYAAVVVYGDMRADRRELFEAYRDAITVMQSLEMQIEANTKAIESVTHQAHN